MPAYYSINIEFDRRSIDYTTVDELNFYLKQAGLRFRKGYWSGEGLSEKEITDRNQELLEKNYVPEPETDFSEGYVQTMYDLEGFSGVRGFFINAFPGKESFVYELVIEEDEVLEEDGITMKNETAGRILDLITKIWRMPSVQTIQTTKELEGKVVPAADFGKWKLPAANPYALVSELQLKKIETEGFDVRKFHVGGVILTSKRYMFV